MISLTQVVYRCQCKRCLRELSAVEDIFNISFVTSHKSFWRPFDWETVIPSLLGCVLIEKNVLGILLDGVLIMKKFFDLFFRISFCGKWLTYLFTCSRLSDGCNELTNLQKQSHLQNKKTIPIWKSEQSMADRAHPVHSRKPRKSFTHCDLKPFQLSETDQREANNYCLGKKSIMNEGLTQRNFDNSHSCAP